MRPGNISNRSNRGILCRPLGRLIGFDHAQRLTQEIPRRYSRGRGTTQSTREYRGSPSLLSLIIGHWLALGRARRKERNEAAAPLRKWLLREVEEPSSYSKRPSLAERDAFVQCLSAGERKGFSEAFIALDHADACERHQDEVGQVSYRDADRVRRAARECLCFTGCV